MLDPGDDPPKYGGNGESVGVQGRPGIDPDPRVPRRSQPQGPLSREPAPGRQSPKYAFAPLKGTVFPLVSTLPTPGPQLL